MGLKKQTSQKLKHDKNDLLIEAALNESVSNVTAQDLSVSGPMLKLEAEVDKKLNHDTTLQLVCSHWKCRKQTKYKRSS